MNNTELKQVNHTKYLGVIIDDKLNWNAHIKDVTNKVNMARSFLQRNLRVCSAQVKSDYYKSLVHPIIDYACIVWSPHTRHNINQVEMVGIISIKLKWLK